MSFESIETSINIITGGIVVIALFTLLGFFTLGNIDKNLDKIREKLDKDQK